MILLDTNVLSELMRPDPDGAVLAWYGAQPLAALRLTTLSCAEILLGIELLPAGRRRQQLAEQAASLFAEDFGGRILPFDLRAAPAFAAITAARQRSGRPIAPVDALIAAIALVHDAAVATRDGDFAGCGVATVNPWRASR